MTLHTAPSSRTDAANQARQQSTLAMLERIDHAGREMRRERTPITTAGIARRARVSRTFLYQNPAAQQLVAKHATTPTSARPRPQPGDAMDATWRERARNAEAELKRTYDEIGTQRLRIGELLGHIHELEADLPADGIQHLLQDNRARRDRVLELEQHNRRLEERLAGARDNNRFLDKRVAQLEAELLSPAGRPQQPR